MAEVKTKKKWGRPKAIIPWDQVANMLMMGAKSRGIAAMLGIHEDTLYIRCLKDHKITFSEYRQQKTAKGDEMLSAKQYEVAMGGDKTMLIWLGKNRLGQSDKNESKIDSTITQTTTVILPDGEVHE